MEKIDFKKELKGLYQAKQAVQRVIAQQGAFLAVDGQGEPGGTRFEEAMQHLYSVAYTLKFGLKNAGVMDFVVPPLEMLWHDDPALVPDPKQWRWRALIRVPNEVTDEQVQSAKRTVAEKQPFHPSDVALVTWDEGASLQVLHVGPYDQVGPSYEQLEAAAKAKGVALTGSGHEVYLSDPRRSAPEKLKTIVRMPVATTS